MNYQMRSYPNPKDFNEAVRFMSTSGWTVHSFQAIPSGEVIVLWERKHLDRTSQTG